jgi:hypothetical protein
MMFITAWQLSIMPNPSMHQTLPLRGIAGDFER